MAMKKCKECGQEVSTQAKACPNCGAKDPTGIKKKGCLIGCLGVAGLILLVVVVVAIGIISEDEPPMPYQTLEEFDLAPAKWQIDVQVEPRPDDTLDQRALEDLARFIAASKKAALGDVERWWVSFYLPTSDRNKGPVAVIHWENGKTEFKWVTFNYPPDFKGAAK